MLFRDIFPQVFWAGDDSTQGGLYNSYQFLKTTEVFFRFVTASMGKGGWLGSPWLPRTPVGGSNPCQPRGLGLPSQTQLRGQSSRTEHSSHALPGTPSGDQEAHLESRLKEGVHAHWRWVPPSYTSPTGVLRTEAKAQGSSSLLPCWAPLLESEDKLGAVRYPSGGDVLGSATWYSFKGLGDGPQPWLPSGWWSSKKGPGEAARLPGCLPRDSFCSILPRRVTLPVQVPPASLRNLAAQRLASVTPLSQQCKIY